MKRAFLACLCLSLTVAAQEKTTFEERDALRLANDKIALTILPEGGSMISITLADDAEKVNPLWNPYWIAREAKLKPPTNLFRGHFVCLDGFGPVSEAERDAGLVFHGEAPAKPWQLTSAAKQGATTSASFTVALPIVQETFARTFHIVDGEQIVWVDSQLTSLLGFDRPVFWGEHATVSAPFLQPGRVAVDMPAHKSKTKAYQVQPNQTRQLQSYVDFNWPMAPTTDGQMFDVRTAPMKPNTTDHATVLIDPARKIGFVTALHLDKKLLIGWAFRREDFPWVQTWLSNPGPNRMARGLEFATQPFDLPRADVLRHGPLFETPVYRILPAKSTIEAKFLMFYTKVPDKFQRVDDVQLSGGTLIVQDRSTGTTIRLAASRQL